MVRAWMMDDSDLDQRTPHMTDPPQFVELDTLKQNTGVEYFQIDADNYLTCAVLEQIKRDRGYTYEDEIHISEDKLPDYHKKLKMFYEEHIHADDEIRLILDGTGYFDVRDANDQWIRIELAKGDMIALPAGIYHRFTLDTKDFIVAKRYFIGEPVWTPHNRPCDEHEARQNYVAMYCSIAA